MILVKVLKKRMSEINSEETYLQLEWSIDKKSVFECCSCYFSTEKSSNARRFCLTVGTTCTEWDNYTHQIHQWGKKIIVWTIVNNFTIYPIEYYTKPTRFSLTFRILILRRICKNYSLSSVVLFRPELPNLFFQK